MQWKTVFLFTCPVGYFLFFSLLWKAVHFACFPVDYCCTAQLSCGKVSQQPRQLSFPSQRPTMSLPHRSYLRSPRNLHSRINNHEITQQHLPQTVLYPIAQVIPILPLSYSVPSHSLYTHHPKLLGFHVQNFLNFIFPVEKRCISRLSCGFLTLCTYLFCERSYLSFLRQNSICPYVITSPIFPPSYPSPHFLYTHTIQNSSVSICKTF